jgi:HTH-type transcriptional regulator/antitoxin HigA
LLIDEYEKKHYSIEAPDPIEAIVRTLKQSDLQKKMVVNA